MPSSAEAPRHHTPDPLPEGTMHGPVKPTLKDMLVSMKLPGDTNLGEGTPSTGFPPDIQRELQARMRAIDRVFYPEPVSARDRARGIGRGVTRGLIR